MNTIEITFALNIKKVKWKGMQQTTEWISTKEIFRNFWFQIVWEFTTWFHCRWQWTSFALPITSFALLRSAALRNELVTISVCQRLTHRCRQQIHSVLWQKESMSGIRVWRVCPECDFIERPTVMSGVTTVQYSTGQWTSDFETVWDFYLFDFIFDHTSSVWQTPLQSQTKQSKTYDFYLFIFKGHCSCLEKALHISNQMIFTLFLLLFLLESLC